MFSNMFFPAPLQKPLCPSSPLGLWTPSYHSPPLSPSVLCAPLAFKPTQEPAPSAAVQTNDTAAKELALAKKEIANLKREITNLKVSNTKLRSGKKEREVVQKAKRDRKRKMGRTANPIVCESDPPLLQAVGEAFWEATVGLSVTGDGDRGQVKTGKHERQNVLIDFVKAAWGGEVWAKLKKECYAAKPSKIAHETLPSKPG